MNVPRLPDRSDEIGTMARTFNIFTSNLDEVIASAQDPQQVELAESLYGALRKAGIDTLLDDRAERAGVKFKDADLIGFPVRVVIGGKALAKGVVEVSTRREKKAEGVPPAKVVEVVAATLAAGAKTLAG